MKLHTLEIEEILRRHGVKSQEEEADRPPRSARAIDALIADLQRARVNFNLRFV